MAPVLLLPSPASSGRGGRFEPHDKTVPGMGPHDRGDGGPAGAGDGRRKRGAPGGRCMHPRLWPSERRIGRRGMDGWTDRREWASRWEAGTWSTSSRVDGTGLAVYVAGGGSCGAAELAPARARAGRRDGAECRARRTRWYGGRRRRESCSDTWDWLDGSVKGLNEKAK